MAGYSTIAIIYNPRSTGPGKKLAEKFQARLAARLPDQHIELIATKYTGNAEELAYTIAKSSESALIVSASGDGGYHEVVNGALQAQAEGARAATGLLPAGNANDHYHNVHTKRVVDAICQGDEQRIDVLKLTTHIDGKAYERYAHSYIGFGLTAKIGRKLSDIKGKKLKEMWAVTQTVFTARPTQLVLDGTVTKVHSLILSNVRIMAKHFTISHTARSDDGKFEVSLFSSRNRLLLAGALIKRMLFGLKKAKQVTAFSFKTVGSTLVQLDGEVFTIDADAPVSVRLEPKALHCIV